MHKAEMAPVSPRNTETRLIKLVKTAFPSFSLNPADLKSPSKEFVVEFYCVVMTEFCLSLENVMRVHENQIVSVLHPELFSDIIPLLNLSKFLGDIFQKIQGASRFGLGDVVNSTQSRTVAFMYTITNFYAFADQNVGTLIERTAELHKRKDRLDELQRELEQLVAQQNEKALMKVKGQDCQQEVTKIQSGLKKVREEVKRVEDEILKKEGEIEEIKRSISRLRADNSEAAANMKKLEQQIVQSPEALKFNHMQLESKLKDLDVKSHDAFELMGAKKKLLKQIGDTGKVQDLLRARLDEITHCSKQLELYDHQLSELEEEHDGLLSAASKLQSENRKTQERSAAVQEQWTSLTLMWEKNKSALNENVRHLKKEHDELLSKRSETSQGLRRQLQDTNTEISELVETNLAMNKKYQELYDILLKDEQEAYERSLAKIKITSE